VILGAAHTGPFAASIRALTTDDALWWWLGHLQLTPTSAKVGQRCAALDRGFFAVAPSSAVSGALARAFTTTKHRP
jgi:hypothetical protein